MSFMSRLAERARRLDSLLCVGLDPHPGDLVSPSAAGARDFCLRLIEATSGLAPAYKPNSAFFEIYGQEGYTALEQVVRAARSAGLVILDAKRGDIASTAEAYARAVFDTLGADAVTASPYLGGDSLAPFLIDPDRGVFVLCKTSNPGSADLQDLRIHGRAGSQTIYEQVALSAQRWNKADNLGLVVGATDSQALARVRGLAADMWLLAPGVGAQGGDLEEALEAGLRSDGLGLLVPISRAIARSEDPRRAAQELRDRINRFRRAERSFKPGAGLKSKADRAARMALADRLLAAGCVQFGEFTLKSGLKSPFYLDLRRLVAYPELLAGVAGAYQSILEKLDFDRLAGLPYAALPIATAISLKGGWPMIYPRKEAKSYGTRADIEGEFQSGESVALIDDLATTGGSKFEAIQKLESAGLRVQDVVVLIDRESGAAHALAKQGYRMHAVLTMSEMIDHWEKEDRISSEQINAVREFLARPPDEA